MEQGEQSTILWVRHCGSCRRIDRRDWFDAEETATERAWSCPGCGSTDFVLLRTRW